MRSLPAVGPSMFPPSTTAAVSGCLVVKYAASVSGSGNAGRATDVVGASATSGSPPLVWRAVTRAACIAASAPPARSTG